LLEGKVSLDLRVDGKVALVTGSDSGIGQEIACTFAENGADVVVNYRGDRIGAEATAARVEMAGRRSVVIRADVGIEDEVEALFNQIDQTFGRIDILVNNAGHGGGAPIHELALDIWDRVLRTNLYGPFLCSRAAARRFISQGQGGRIMNISSVHEEACTAGGAPYCVSKAGVRNLTRTQALELGEYGITVNDIAPGMILTPMNKRAIDDDGYRQEAEAKIPLQRAGVPSDIAHMALFLATDLASYCTGSTFFVDGGWMLSWPDV
jgi:glucose 1-dehydrogenase